MKGLPLPNESLWWAYFKAASFFDASGTRHINFDEILWMETCCLPVVTFKERLLNWIDEGCYEILRWRAIDLAECDWI